MVVGTCTQCKRKSTAKRIIDDKGLCNDCNKKVSCNAILAELDLNNDGTVGNLTTIDFMRCIQSVVQTSYEELNKRVVDLENKLINANKEREKCLKKCEALEKDVNVLREDVERLEEEINDQSKILTAQQRFLEDVDTDKRQKHLIVLGLAENNNVDDKDEFLKIIERIGVPEEHLIITNVLRLGRIDEQNEQKKRPLKVSFKKRTMRDEVLKNARKLKDEGGNSPYKKVFLKRDTHPDIRKEEKRLYDVFKAEKDKPVNADNEVIFDRRKRIVTCNGEEIDRFRLFSSFQ